MKETIDLKQENAQLRAQIEELTKTQKSSAEEKDANESRYWRLFKESEQKSLENTMLFASARAVFECREFESAAHTIFDSCREAIGAQSGYVALLSVDGEENEVLFLESGGLSCSVNPDLPMPIRGLRAEAYKLHKTVYENDFKSSKWMKHIPRGHVELRNVMFVPMNIKGETVGIMGLANKPSDFTERDAHIAQTFGELAAIALRNTHAEEAIRKERDFAKTLVQTAQTIVLVLDKKARIVSFNPFMEEISGYKLEEVQGKDWFTTFLPNEDHDRIHDLFEKAVANMVVHGNVNPIVTKSGELREITWYAKTLKDSEGKPIGLLSTGHDITEQKKIEERLRLSEKMEAIGHLAGGIAHDFNNILGGIVGYADLSMDNTGPGSVLEKNLTQILKAADRAKHLVGQILSFSRPSSDKKEFVFLRPIIQEVRDLFEATIPSSVELVFELESETQAVFVESTKIHEALLNLGSNAVHAMNEKGKMTIRLKENEYTSPTHGLLGENSPGKYSIIEVSDTGCGMDEATRERAFEPFFTTKPVGKGTGMGLSVVFGIMQSHGGNIQVDSEVGTGTTFRFFFPKSDQITRASPNSYRSLPKGSERILFVDDEPIINEMARDLLTSLGYRVRTVSDSRKALDILLTEAASIDLLITDQTMPNLTGAELAKKALGVREDLPVILCTGYSSGIDPERAKELGIAKFCYKPLTRREMGEAIREVLD
ncbi:MAG: PAS domain S-box protein [Deltaproteobacteria bacterium]|nr:PAS domain S-box protein [Deltaproteobacteria bacterium]